MSEHLINKSTFLPKITSYLDKLSTDGGLDEDEAHRFNRCLLIAEELAYQYGGRRLKDNMKIIDEAWFAGFIIGIFSVDGLFVSEMLIPLTSCDKILQRLNTATAEALVAKVDLGLYELVETQRLALVAAEQATNKEILDVAEA